MDTSPDKILDECVFEGLVLPTPVNAVNDKKETQLFYFRELCFMPEVPDNNCTWVHMCEFEWKCHVNWGTITESALPEGTHFYDRKLIQGLKRFQLKLIRMNRQMMNQKNGRRQI